MELQSLTFPVLFSSCFFIFMVLKLWRRSDSNHNLPPGPTKLPVIGNMHQLVGSPPHIRLRDLARKYGSIMHLQLGEVNSVVISSAEAAKQVMKTHDINFATRPFLLTVSIITYNFKNIVFAPYGEYWRQMKKIAILELLSAKRVQTFRPIREEEASNVVSTISSFSGKPFNFSRKLFSSSYTVAARAAFGKKCKDQEAFIPLAEEITETAGGFSVSDLFPSLKFLHVISGMKSKLLRHRKEADRIFESILNDHKAKRKAGNKSGEAEVDDVVDVLLRLQEEGDLEVPLTNDSIKAVILDMFLAGSETSAATVEWAMSEMLKNPRVMKKAQEEVRRVFGDKGKVNEADLHQLDYLKSVIKETLRLHPPLPLLLPRECMESCELNGYNIPAKFKVIVNAWAIGRDPNHWDNAETFYPERFLDSTIDYKGNNFEFLPFGAGRRICPGISFATANVELSLAQFLYNFNWELANGLKAETLDMDEGFGVTMRRKNDLHLIATPYKANPDEESH